MKYACIAFLGLVLIGCDTTHKLTGTDYVDIETEQTPPVAVDYPSQIIEAVGWSDITSELKPKGTEEVRFWMSSDLYPAHLFKMEKDKRGEVQGEVLLYWPNDTTKNSSDFTHQMMKRYLEGTCTEFFTTASYGYCFPELDETIKWSSIYVAAESQDFWQIPAGVNAAKAERNWQMYVQMRLRNFYRDYQHVNAHDYEDEVLKTQIIQLVRAVRNIKNRFESAVGTNSFEGITDGTSFTLCDSSETWEFNGDLTRLLENAGFTMQVKTEEDNSLYYIMVKGRLAPIWYYEWATNEFDRRLYPNEIYDIRAVNKFECPSDLVSD
jgi:hypothetical protein